MSYAKIIKTLCCLILFCALSTLACTAVAQENSTKIPQAKQETTRMGEIWTGKIYSSTYRAGACLSDDGKIYGVLYLTLKNGQVDTYHFQGTVSKDGLIDAKHKSGYRFIGRFDDAVNMSGEVILNSGYTIGITGNRLQNSKLTERCGPLPE